MGRNTPLYRAGFKKSEIDNLQALAASDVGAIASTLDNLSATELGYIDGVTAGTKTASKALVVDANGLLGGADLGGLLYVNTADSTEVTADSGDASTAETAFDVDYTIPANTLAVGDTLRVKGVVLFTDSDSSAAGTVIIKVKVDGQIVSALSGTLSNDIGGGGPANEFASFDVTLGIRTTATGLAHGSLVHDIGGTATAEAGAAAISSIDTTGTMAVTVTVQFGTEDADNAATLKQLAVYRNA